MGEGDVFHLLNPDCDNVVSFINHSFFYLFFKPPTRKKHILGTNMSLHSSSSVNGEGSTPKDPLYKLLDELRSLKFQMKKRKID